LAELPKPKAQRNPLPKLPPHVRLPRPRPTKASFAASSKHAPAPTFAAEVALWEAESAAYNSAAIELFSRVGAMKCPACVAAAARAERKARDKALKEMERERASGAAALNASPSSPAAAAAAVESPRVYLSPSTLLAHMATCCPEDVPDAGAEALEALRVSKGLVMLIRAE